MIVNYPCREKVYDVQKESARFICYIEYDDTNKKYSIILSGKYNEAYYNPKDNTEDYEPYYFDSKDEVMAVIKKYLV